MVSTSEEKGIVAVSCPQKASDGTDWRSPVHQDSTYLENPQKICSLLRWIVL
ncbi:unnamed protein product, partial [Larinioides sclopetarius]